MITVKLICALLSIICFALAFLNVNVRGLNMTAGGFMFAAIVIFLL